MIGSHQRRLRVAIVVGSLDRGGMERLAVLLARRLDRALFEPILVFLPDTGALRAELGDVGLPVLYMGQRGVQPRIWWRLRRLLARHGIDLVNSHDWGATFYAAPAARLAGRPCIHTEHGQLKVEPGQTALRRFVLRSLCARIACVSSDLAAHVQSVLGIAAARLVVIPNGIDVARYRSGAAARAGARQRLGLEPGDLLVGYVGRLSREKGVLNLAPAAAELAAELPQVRFVLIGAGPLRERLEGDAADAGLGARFQLPGERDDVPACLAAMDIFVLPSFTEGQSLSLMEAISAGKPVVATRVGGNAELLDEGAGGILVPPGDPGALARAIGELVRDPARRERMAAANARRAEARFDMQRMVDDYQQLFQQVAAPRGIAS